MMHKVALVVALVPGLVLAGTTGAAAQALDGRLKQIAATKSIAIAHRTDAAPFSFLDANREPAGFTIDLCRRVVASIEKQLGVSGLKVKYVPVTTQTRFEAIAKGQADLECGASTITLARMKTVDFSSVVFMNTTGLLARSATGAKSLPDLAGKRIAAVRGTSNERALANQLARQQVKATVVPMGSSDEAIAALDAGSVDAFASDTMLLVGLTPRSKDPKALALLGDLLSYEPYGIALPRGDASLRLAVNTALSQTFSSDAIDEIFSRWFGAFGKPTTLTEAVYILGTFPE